MSLGAFKSPASARGPSVPVNAHSFFHLGFFIFSVALCQLAIMPYSLLYRRPSVVSSVSSTSTSAWSIKKPAPSEAGQSYLPNGVPDDLSFDRIISGKTCKVRQPMRHAGVIVEHALMLSSHALSVTL